MDIVLLEIEKYKKVIEMVAHIKNKKFSFENFDFELGQLHGLIEGCVYTTVKVAGTEETPLSGAVSMLGQNLLEADFDREISRAWSFYNKLHQAFRAPKLDS